MPLVVRDHADIAGRTADPAPAAGRLWYRSDLGRLCYSPDGSTIRCLPPSPIGTDDIADRAVTRAKLEYPTVDVSFFYLHAIGKATFVDAAGFGLVTTDSFADSAVEGGNTPASSGWLGLLARFSNRLNYYGDGVNPGATTADYFIYKLVNGTQTTLASEAVDLSYGGYLYRTKLSCVGTTINGFRDDMTTPKVSVTDTSFSSGKFGARQFYGNYAIFVFPELLRAPSSPSPKPVAYLEVPVVGSGTEDDPFRAQMPEEIAWEWSLNPRAKRKYDILKARGFTDEEIIELLPEVLSARVNRLALTHSSLIKTDRATGRPTEYVAVVRVFEQPDRPAYLYPIGRALDALRSMKGVRVLSREEAIRRAKQIDPDLTDVDLLPIKPTDPRFKQILKDYIAHRIAMGVREELIDEKLMERYIQEDKGW